MSDPTKAVFLSYASQDAEAAKRIADALRSAGVEVWFDAEGGLEHGDEWDAKIRRQIKECVLFLPIISANTQAREEGYFRIEWELAAQRALGIASGVAFILPIVIDDTREPDALVPDRFRTVQWTRLRGGGLTPEVKSRFLKLWSHRTGALKHEAAVGRDHRIPPESDKAGFGDPARQGRPGWKVYAGLAAAVFALAAGAVWWLLRPGSASAPASDTGSGPAPIVSPARPAREWPKDPELKKAFAIITGLDATIESCRLAEDMINAVLKQRPTDPEATTLYAMLNNYYINRGYDASEERQVLARRFSERALQLAPDEPEALAAMAQYLTFRGTDYARADALIRKAMALAPEDPRFARILVYNVLRPTDLPRALAQAKEDAARFPQDPLTQYDLALISRGAGDLELMEEAIDRTLALAPLPSALIWKGWLAAWMHGDLPGFKRWLDRISGNFRFNERAVYMHYLYACLSGDTAHGLEALQAFPGSWMNDFYYIGPRSLLLADLLALAGKPELAQVEYGRALAEIGRMAERDGQGAAWRAEFWALRGAGREADARAAAKRMMQRLNRPYRPPIMQWWHDVIPAQLLAGERADALALIREAVVSPAVRAQIQTALKIDQRMAPFRDDPEIQALLGDAAKTATVAGQAPRVWPKHPELKKAIDLIEGTESIPDDFALAEQIVQPIVDRTPTDLEAVTVMARVQSQYMRRGFDRSDERSARARLYGERALQLDPNEPEAMLAVATYLFARTTGEARAERLLRRAMELDPANPRHGRILADLLNVQSGRQAEALAQSQENVRRFPQDALSRYDLARHYKDQGRYEEFDRELDAVLALTPLPNAIAWKARLQFGLHNDFPGMKRWLDKVPERVRGTERTVFGYFLYAAFGGDTETGLDALRAFTQKWFTDFEYAGPTALLNADLLVRQGKAELARQQYEAAWLEIQKMRAADPARIWLNQAEFWTLLGLGRKAEASQAFRRLVEGQRRPYAQSLFTGWWFTLIPGALLIGERDTALEFLRECVATLPEGRGAIRVRMQLDPRMAPFRDDPEIKALLADPGSVPAVSAPKSDDKSVAVLAFANLSDDKNNEYFSDGISEELLNVLAKVPGLKVSARTSAFYFKGKEVPIPEIAKQLGVAYVVEGSVRKQGDKVRITAQLIKAADGFHVWSDTFTRDLKDIFAVQDEIAGLIARQLQLKLAVGHDRGTVDPALYEMLLQGRALTLRESNEDWRQAIALYRRALEREPGLALAWAEMARTYVQLGRFGGMPIQDAMREARAAAQRALDLEPDQATGLVALGWVQRTADWDWRAARRSFQRALELAPGNAAIMGDLAVFYFNTGRVAEATALARRAVERDPLNARAQASLGFILNLNGDWELALAPLRQAVALAPAIEEVRSHQARALMALGRVPEAAAAAEQEPNEAYRLIARAFIPGPAADAALAEFVTKYGEEMPGYVANIHGIRGEIDPAFAWFERALARRDAAVVWVKTNVNNRSLRADPRWPAFLRKVGLADDQLK